MGARNRDKAGTVSWVTLAEITPQPCGDTWCNTSQGRQTGQLLECSIFLFCESPGYVWGSHPTFQKSKLRAHRLSFRAQRVCTKTQHTWCSPCLCKVLSGGREARQGKAQPIPAPHSCVSLNMKLCVSIPCFIAHGCPLPSSLHNSPITHTLSHIHKTKIHTDTHSLTQTQRHAERHNRHTQTHTDTHTCTDIHRHTHMHTHT